MAEINNITSVKTLEYSYIERVSSIKKRDNKDLLMRVFAIVLLIIATIFLLVGTFVHPPLRSWLIGWMGGAAILIVIAVNSVIASLNYCKKKQTLDVRSLEDLKKAPSIDDDGHTQIKN